jgi:hypothetical protein
MQVFFLIIAASLLVPLYLIIIFWNWIALGIYGCFGISGSVEVDGIHLSNTIKIINRLLLWQDIVQVDEVYQPPFFYLMVLLKSNELVKIDFRSDRNLELVLKEHNIPFVKKHNIMNRIGRE